MKKLVLILAFVVIAGSAVLAQAIETVYVSAKGNPDVLGLSEAEPTNFLKALMIAMYGYTKKRRFRLYSGNGTKCSFFLKKNHVFLACP